MAGAEMRIWINPVVLGRLWDKGDDSEDNDRALAYTEDGSAEVADAATEIERRRYAREWKVLKEP